MTTPETGSVTKRMRARYKNRLDDLTAEGRGRRRSAKVLLVSSPEIKDAIDSHTALIEEAMHGDPEEWGARAKSILTDFAQEILDHDRGEAK